MRELASGTMAGPEARGRVRIVAAVDGTRTVEIADFWVAPGAPDVRLYVSPRGDGVVDATSTELGPVADAQATQSWILPVDVSVASAASIIVFCHVYSVYFGHAELRWLAA
jgi:hypothetical protein